MVGAVKDLIKKSYNENKLAHAFLVETNNLEIAMNDVKDLVKYFYLNDKNDNLDSSNISNLIDNETLPSLKIIRPEGTQIKKDQIKNLISSFVYNPIYGKRNVYIISNAEKLNDYSSNSMLKFIEEPESDVIGFLLVKNMDNIISTIRSRCVKIKFVYDTENMYEDLNIDRERFEEYIKISNSIIEYIVNSDDLLIHIKSLLNEYFNNKDDIEIIFTIIMYLCQNELLSRNKCTKRFIEKSLALESINDIKLTNLLYLLIAFLNDINYNVNIELFVDKFCIEVKEL